MSEEARESEDFDVQPIVAPDPDKALIVSLDGFEGPLDLLLNLARDQKVDLAKISVLALADQYLAFIDTARVHKLELAADYLVMAAWLIYFKSRLVLPQEAAEPGPGAQELAAMLRWRLQRLAAMREAAARLMAGDRLSRDVFARGAPEPVVVVKEKKHTDTLYDLLTAYSQQRVKKMGHSAYHVVRAPIYLIEEARDRIERILGTIPDWRILTRFLPPEWNSGPRRRSALASTFSACLELARDGRVEIRQMAPFGEIFLKDRVAAEEARP